MQFSLEYKIFPLNSRLRLSLWVERWVSNLLGGAGQAAGRAAAPAAAWPRPLLYHVSFTEF